MSVELLDGAIFPSTQVEQNPDVSPVQQKVLLIPPHIPSLKRRQPAFGFK